MAWHLATPRRRPLADRHHPHGERFDVRRLFERFADRLCRRLDDGTRDTILRLKYETPENEGIHGVEYYRAVLEGGVRTLEGLRRWRAAHPLEGVDLWMP